MAFDRQHIKITWGFEVNGTDEVADTSLNFTSSSGWAGAAAVIGSLSDAPQEFLGHMDAMLTQVGWADYSNLRTVKIAAIGTNGLYVAEPLSHETITPYQGAATQVLPQATVVASLRSGFSLGRANYGRMYLPHTTPGLEAETPYIPASSLPPLAGYIKTFINDVSDSLNLESPSVLFPAIMSQVGAGTAKQIVSVGAGPVVDTQRRRRNRLNDTAVLVTL